VSARFTRPARARLRRGPRDIECQQPRQDRVLLGRARVRVIPAIRRPDRPVERLVPVRQPGRTLVVEVGQRSLLQLRLAGSRWVELGPPLLVELPRRVGDRVQPGAAPLFLPQCSVSPCRHRPAPRISMYEHLPVGIVPSSVRNLQRDRRTLTVGGSVSRSAQTTWPDKSRRGAD